MAINQITLEYPKLDHKQEFNYEYMRNIRKVYWYLHQGACNDISDAFHQIMKEKWHGPYAFCEYSGDERDEHHAETCSHTLCQVMSTTPSQDSWFRVPSTWKLTYYSSRLSYYILKFSPYISINKYDGTYSPTRLLSIRTGIVVSGSTSKEYFIVSHVWKSGFFTMVDGRLSRGSKGYVWLERMSKLLGVSYVWIDTCCVNQDDPLDKRREIPKMGKYYKNAIACAVLPDSTYNRDVDDLIASIRILFSTGVKFMEPAHAWALTCIYYSKFLGDIWFTRIWTIQEIMLNKIVVVDSSCGLVDVRVLLRMYYIIAKEVGSIPMSCNMENVRMLAEIVDIPELDMSMVLNMCIGREATVRHDYVYGIMGMLPNIHMDVNYDISPEGVMIKLYKKLLEYGDTSWLSWIGPSSVGKGKNSWLPTIGSYVVFVRWDMDMIVRCGRRNLMNVICTNIAVDVIGGSTSKDLYHAEIQPIVTLDDLCVGSMMCPGCLTVMMCNRGCCRPWMVVKAMKETPYETISLVCNSCLTQQPEDADDSLCKYHISSMFRRTLAYHLWLVKCKTKAVYMLVAIKRSGEKSYGRRIRRVKKYMPNARVLISGNIGWLYIAKTKERIGVVIASTQVIPVRDKYVYV